MNHTEVLTQLSAFDKRLIKHSKMEIEFPHPILASRLLKSCNLNEIHFQLALSTTSEMWYKNDTSLNNGCKKCPNNFDFSPDWFVFGHKLALPNVPVLEPITALSLKTMRGQLTGNELSKAILY